MSRDVILPDQSKASYDNFHFAPAVRSSKGLVFCSGQIGAGEDGAIPESPEQEFRNAWAAVGQVLAEAGLGYDDIIEFTTFHVGLQDHLAALLRVPTPASRARSAWVRFRASRIAARRAQSAASI